MEEQLGAGRRSGIKRKKLEQSAFSVNYGLLPSPGPAPPPRGSAQLLPQMMQRGRGSDPFDLRPPPPPMCFPPIDAWGKGQVPAEGIDKEHMFSKVLTPRDVGKVDRLVIPRQHGEKHFPHFPLDAAASSEKGILLVFEDPGGKRWRFRYSGWNSSQRYAVLTEEWYDFVRDKCLVAGDTVSFYRGVGKAGLGRLFVGYRRRDGDRNDGQHRHLLPPPPPKKPTLPLHLPLATPMADLSDPYSILRDAIRRLFHQLVHVRATASCPTGAQLSDALFQTLKYLTSNAQEHLQYLHYTMILTVLGNTSGRYHNKAGFNVSAASSSTMLASASPSKFHCAEQLRVLSTIQSLEGSIHHIRQACGSTLKNCRLMSSLSPSIMCCVLLCRGILGIMTVTDAKDTNENQEPPVLALDDLSCPLHRKAITGAKAQRIPARVVDPIYLLLTAIRSLMYLDLSGCSGITLLPSSLGTLSNLSALNLSSCSSLRILPPSLGRLLNLQVLVLSCCQKLKILPVSVCECTMLRLLDLSGCSSLEILPHSFANLAHLEILNLSDCKRLTELPQPFGNLQGLESLNLSGCHGVDMDVECLSKLANLKCLSLSPHTNFQRFPDSFQALANWLDMSRWWRKNRVHLHCNPEATSLHLYRSHEQSIINKLLLEGSDNGGAISDQIVTSICIVGESGMGKSELVCRIYNDKKILEAFDLRIWVLICDKKRLLGKIVECTTNAYCSDAPISVLEEIVVEELTGKRLLLVLDDSNVESQFVWSDLQRLLNVCAKGSALIVTTKSREVTNLVGATQTCYLSSLSNEQCFSIFKGHVLSGSDMHFNPQLEIIGRKIVKKCGGNALCIKSLSGLFCHSEIGLSEIDMLVDGIFPALRLCYNLLPEHLQLCFKFCSLFPRDYIFSKHLIVRLWIAQGFVCPEGGSQPEDSGIHYFDELFCRSFFQRSPSHSDQEDKFVMHELFHDLAHSVSENECFRCEKPFCSIIDNISHLSVVLSDFKTVALAMEHRNLQSFLVIRRSFPVARILRLDDLYLKNIFLRALDLSYTDILELPSSIGNMKHLRLLALNNTKINGLPLEIGQVDTLQTLELKNCSHLIDLPRSTSNLTNLRHLDVQKEPGNANVGMPYGIGQLTDLQTLAIYYVGNDLLHCSIGELKNLNGLRGHVHITGLENVKTADDAREASMVNKHFLEALTFEWSYSNKGIDDDLGKELCYEILQNLRPNGQLQELVIRNYAGNLFPVWMQDSYICKLVSVTLDNCHECSELPYLSDLPSLKNLFIQRMNLIESFGTNSNSWVTERIHSPRFPSLEILTLCEMYSLKFWPGTSEGDYPRLCCLSISRCPKLISLPRLNSLVHLSFYFGGQVPSFSELPLLESLKIEGFQKIKFIHFPDHIKTLRKLEISGCKELLSLSAYLLSISNLQVVRCPKLDFVGTLMEDRLEQIEVYSRNGLTRKSLVLKTMTYKDLHDDGWDWKNYGEKNTIGSKFSRSYYRCVNQNSGCTATKVLQPNDNDPNTLSVMYISEHNHESPIIVGDESTLKRKMTDFVQ